MLLVVFDDVGEGTRIRKAGRCQSRIELQKKEVMKLVVDLFISVTTT